MIHDRSDPICNRTAPLFATFGIGHCLLQRAFCGANTLAANTQTGIVHHGKHCAHAIMWFTNQPTFGIVILHNGGWAAMQTHFVFQRHNIQRIRHTGIAVFIRDQFGHNKQ